MNQFQLLEQEFKVFLKSSEQNSYSIKFIATWTLLNELLWDSFLQYFKNRINIPLDEQFKEDPVKQVAIKSPISKNQFISSLLNSTVTSSTNRPLDSSYKQNLKMPKSGSDSLYIMAFSGARGNMSQVSQLTLMRGLMSDPLGKLVEFPIISNVRVEKIFHFKEGLNLTEYLISCYGARKGIIDTGLRTATAGDFTRRLVDVAHSVIIQRFDCGTQNGIYLNDLMLSKNKKNIFPLKQRLMGRIIANHSRIPENYRNKEISHHFFSQGSLSIPSNLGFLNAKNHRGSKIGLWSEEFISQEIIVRSPLTCEASPNPYLCWNAVGRLIDIGEAVGILAAQSLGEPGTQLTLRTFHTGGIYSEQMGDFKVIAPFDGNVIIPHYCTIKKYFNTKEKISTFVTSRIFSGTSPLAFSSRSPEKEKYDLGLKSSQQDLLAWKVSPSSRVVDRLKKANLASTEHYYWENFVYKERFQTSNLNLYKYTQNFINPFSNKIDEKISKEIYHKNSFPKAKLWGQTFKQSSFYTVGGDWLLGAPKIDGFCKQNQVKSAVFFCKQKNIAPKRSEVVGDLWRLAPKMWSPLISHSKLEDKHGGKNISKKKIISVNETLFHKTKQEFSQDSLNLRTEPKYMEKTRDKSPNSENLDFHLHKIILKSSLVKILQKIVNNVQSVYRGQGVEIYDQHIETLISQMGSKIRIKENFQSKFFWNEIVPLSLIKDNTEIQYEPILSGITRISLQTNSFISSASFQSSSKILSQESLKKSKDFLFGLKENIIINELIPSGTGIFIAS
uniref:RNA polymerase beta'' subunit n=1 Tax=Trentepohlia sp. BN17 TaxID=3063876 RepID=UPI001EDD06E2|nr:RNA polymerase beta'' subunit [Trentepohlia sp. BN17]UIB38701.1 RNA polymerase beta'' subunit [Trentepohlia sp. BN17]